MHIPIYQYENTVFGRNSAIFKTVDFVAYFDGILRGPLGDHLVCLLRMTNPGYKRLTVYMLFTIFGCILALKRAVGTGCGRWLPRRAGT